MRSRSIAKFLYARYIQRLPEDLVKKVKRGGYGFNYSSSIHHFSGGGTADKSSGDQPKSAFTYSKGISDWSNQCSLIGPWMSFGFLTAMKGVTVEEEYGKSVKLRREDVMMLKEWAEKQPHLPDIPELHLIFFLQSCRFSTEKAKATIESFFTYRAHWTEFFRDRDPTLPQLRAQLEVAGFLPLPKKTTHGHQIILFRFLNTDPSRFDVNAQIKLFDMCVTQWLMKNGTCEGFAVVCDLKGVVLGHILRANLTSIKRGIMYVQEALFTRLISIHLVNAGSYMDRIMSMIRPFLNEELINMVHCHQNFTLPKDIPVECLPSDYGSLQPSFQELQDANIKRLMDYAEYFRNEDTYIADETKRAVGSVKTTDIFGVEGSFKKLDID